MTKKIMVRMAQKTLMLAQRFVDGIGFTEGRVGAMEEVVDMII